MSEASSFASAARAHQESKQGSHSRPRTDGVPIRCGAMRLSFAVLLALVVAPSHGCSDTDAGAVDIDSDGCAVYTEYPHYCVGSQFDDNDFTASQMCCACGGGDTGGDAGGDAGGGDVCCGCTAHSSSEAHAACQACEPSSYRSSYNVDNGVGTYTCRANSGALTGSGAVMPHTSPSPPPPSPSPPPGTAGNSDTSGGSGPCCGCRVDSDSLAEAACAACGSSVRSQNTYNGVGTYTCRDGTSGAFGPPPSPPITGPCWAHQSESINALGGADACDGYIALCAIQCGGDEGRRVNVENGVGTYRCSCCYEAAVSPAPVDGDGAITLDLGRLPWWVWVLVFALPVLLWLLGALLMWLGRKRTQTNPQDGTLPSKTVLNTDEFEFPFGSRFLLRVEALARCENAGSGFSFVQSLLQYKTDFLVAEKHDGGQPQWGRTAAAPYLKEKSSAYAAYRAWCGPKVPFKGLPQAGWRVKFVFNFLFGLALSIAFGSVALEADSQSSCSIDCLRSNACGTVQTSNTAITGASLELPEGTGLYMTQTALFIAFINLPTTSGASFLLKRSFRIGSICFLLVSAFVLAVGLLAVVGGIVYLTQDEASTATSTSTKIVFCIILKIAGALGGLLVVDVVVNFLIFYVPAKILLARYVGLQATPRDRSKEMTTILGKAASAAAQVIVSVDVGGGVADGGRDRSATDALAAAALLAKAAAFAAAKEAALLKLKTKLKPRLQKKHGLRWEDVEPFLKDVELQDLEEAIDDPEPLLARILVSAAFLVAIAKLRPRLEPVATKHGVKWEDLKGVLQIVDTVEELEAAADDPEAFLLRLADAATPAAKALALAKLRPKLEPLAEKRGLKWDDLLPVLELVDSVDELQAAVSDPEAFLLGLANQGYKIGLKLAIAKARPKLEPAALKRGVPWADLILVLEAVDSIEELEAAAHDPEAFLRSFADAATPAAKAFAIAKLRPKLEPVLKKRGLSWEDALPVLELVHAVDELQAAVTDPEAFLQRLANEGGRVALKLLAVQLRPRLEPVARKHGVAWGDLLPVLEAVDTLQELEAAADDPEAFLRRLADATTPAAKAFATAKLRPTAKPSKPLAHAKVPLSSTGSDLSVGAPHGAPLQTSSSSMHYESNAPVGPPPGRPPSSGMHYESNAPVGPPPGRPPSSGMHYESNAPVGPPPGFPLSAEVGRNPGGSNISDGSSSVYSQLKELKGLLDTGVLTHEEFDLQKANILSDKSSSKPSIRSDGSRVSAQI